MVKHGDIFMQKSSGQCVTNIVEEIDYLGAFGITHGNAANALNKQARILKWRAV